MQGIYKITSPSGKIYIGQSVDIKRRFKKYKSLDCKHQIKLYNSFLKYGYINHKFEIILECEFEQLNELERFYQDLYNVVSKNGLNCLLTETSTKKSKVSDETRKRLSESGKGKKRSEETCRRISESKKGNQYGKGFKHSEEAKLKIGLASKSRKSGMLGKNHSEETIKKITESNKNKVISEETRLKMSVARKNYIEKNKK